MDNSRTPFQISNFPALSDVNSAIEIPVNDAGVTKNITKANLFEGQPLDVLNYPYVGSWRGQAGGTHFYLGDGNSGVVREIWMLYDKPVNWVDLNNHYLRIWTDKGTMADEDAPTDSGYDFQISLAQLCQTYERASMADKEIIDSAYSTVGYSADYTQININLRVPIPFSNGILVQTGTYIEGVWTKTTPGYYYCWYELGDLPDFKYKNYRLKCTGAHSVAGLITSVPIKTTLINEASGGGRLVSLFCAGHAVTPLTVDLNPLESTPFYVAANGGSDEPICPGGEDIWVCEPYFGAFGAQQKALWGMTVMDSTDFKYAGYRHFISQNFSWEDGFVFKMSWSDAGSTTRIDSDCIYYQEKPTS